MDELYRTIVEPDLEVRSGGDGRTVYGIAVPWNRPMRINSGLTEEWAPGTFDHQLRAAHRVRYAREHLKLGGTLIGRATVLRNDAKGQYVELHVSKTPVGDETLELIKDGALRHLSVGFHERPRGQRLVSRDGTSITQRVKADLFEVASTLEGAFGDLATAAGVRSLDDDEHDHVGELVCSRCAQPVRLDQAKQVLASLPPLPLVG